jgi:uncharacterized protein YkwD
MKKLFKKTNLILVMSAIMAAVLYFSPNLLTRNYDSIPATKAANDQTSESTLQQGFAQTQNYPSIDCDDPQSNSFVSQLFNLTNQERQQNGEQPLVWSPALCQSAEFKDVDMINNNYFDHYSPSGVSPWYWFNQTGVKYSTVGENLALNYFTPQSTNQALMNSSGHKANILNDNFTQVGIYYISGEIDNQKAFIVVEHFGRPAQ